MMTERLKAGAIAPDFSFDSPWKKGLKLSGFTKKGTTVLMFLRYMGCPVCQMKIAELRKEIGEFTRRKVNLLVVLQSTPDNVCRAVSEKDIPFVIVCDPKEKLFALYDVKPGSIFRYVTPNSIIQAVKATIRGFKHGKFEGNEKQLPAAFIIDTGRRVRWAHYGANVSDVPKTKKLLAELDRIEKAR
jgi:peroxiredoxin